ncbi:MAG: hypothetical protein AAF915_30630 [Cyanobacteria bacterium P01_D01_bin.50]
MKPLSEEVKAAYITAIFGFIGVIVTLIFPLIAPAIIEMIKPDKDGDDPRPETTITPEPQVTKTPKPQVTKTPEPQVTITPQPQFIIPTEEPLIISPAYTKCGTNQAKKTTKPSCGE